MSVSRIDELVRLRQAWLTAPRVGAPGYGYYQLSEVAANLGRIEREYMAVANQLALPRHALDHDRDRTARGTGNLADFTVRGQRILYRGRYIAYKPETTAPTLGIEVDGRQVSYTDMGTDFVGPTVTARAVFSDDERLIAYTLNNREWWLVSPE